MYAGVAQKLRNEKVFRVFHPPLEKPPLGYHLYPYLGDLLNTHMDGPSIFLTFSRLAAKNGPKVFGKRKSLSMTVVALANNQNSRLV